MIGQATMLHEIDNGFILCSIVAGPIMTIHSQHVTCNFLHHAWEPRNRAIISLAEASNTQDSHSQLSRFHAASYSFPSCPALKMQSCSLLQLGGLRVVGLLPLTNSKGDVAYHFTKCQKFRLFYIVVLE